MSKDGERKKCKIVTTKAEEYYTVKQIKWNGNVEVASEKVKRNIIKRQSIKRHGLDKKLKH